MSDGRSYWWAKDAVWWDRTRVVQLTNQYGAIGGAVLDWLSCHAKQINDGGRVKSGFDPVAKGIGEAKRLEDVENAIRFAVKIGALDEFVEIGEGRFTCRISGWNADQENARSALRQAAARAREAEAAAKEALRSVMEGHGPSRSVTYTGENPKTDIGVVFDAWKLSTGKADAKLGPKRRRLIDKALKSYSVDDLLVAVDGWRFSAHHRGENDRATVYNDLELILRDEGNIERFRDYKRNAKESNGTLPRFGTTLGGANDAL